MSDQSQPRPDGQPDIAQKYDEELVNPPPVQNAAPISADELKAGAKERSKRVMLHAKELLFQHPMTGADIKIDSPLPADFQECLRWLKSSAAPVVESQPSA